MIHHCKGETPTSREIYTALLKQNTMVPEQKETDSTLAILMEAIRECFRNKVEAIDVLKAKILSGYHYQIQGTTMTMGTGKGGVLMYIDACAENHIPAELIEQDISVWVDGRWNPLSSATVTKLKQPDKQIL